MHCQSGKKNHQPEPIPGRISASRESGKSTPVTKPYSFWGRPNLRKTQKTQHRPLPKRQKRTTTLNPYPGRIPASREIGGQTSVTGPYSFWGCPNLRKTQKTQSWPLPKRQKRTTALNPYLEGFLLQEKLGGKLQLQDPTAFEVVQTFAKPKKHNIDHYQSGKKKTQPWTHTWQDSCFKRNWGANFSYRTLQLLRSSKPSQNPKNTTSTTTKAAKKNHNPEPIPGRIPASREIGGQTSVTGPYSFWGRPNLRKTHKNTTSTTTKAAKKNHNPEPIPGRIPASREIGGQTSVTGPYSFWGCPNLRKTQKTQSWPLPKRQKRTTALNPYLEGFLLQEKLGGKLQLQDPTAFEVVQTFAKPKKHKVDHCQSGKKEPQPWTHSWKNPCSKFS